MHIPCPPLRCRGTPDPTDRRRPSAPGMLRPSGRGIRCPPDRHLRDGPRARRRSDRPRRMGCRRPWTRPRMLRPTRHGHGAPSTPGTRPFPPAPGARTPRHHSRRPMPDAATEGPRSRRPRPIRPCGPTVPDRRARRRTSSPPPPHPILGFGPPECPIGRRVHRLCHPSEVPSRRSIARDLRTAGRIPSVSWARVISRARARSSRRPPGRSRATAHQAQGRASRLRRWRRMAWSLALRTDR